jgi:GMP synthase (glutamine-hydrolysing)
MAFQAMGKVMDIVVFRHQQSVSLGSLEAQLNADKKISWRYINMFADSLAGFDPAKPDVLIVLGGSPGVYQADIYPFIKDEVAILRERMSKDLPTLGICLGGQMMASALGAKVYADADSMERGWYPLALTDAGKKSVLSHFDPAQTTMFHWHGDVFDLPKGAMHLASSARCKNQAFSYGKNALALQFHPEANTPLMQEWMIAKAGDAAKGAFDTAAYKREMEQNTPRLIVQTGKFFTDWLQQTA